MPYVGDAGYGLTSGMRVTALFSGPGSQVRDGLKHHRAGSITSTNYVAGKSGGIPGLHRHGKFNRFAGFGNGKCENEA